MVRHNLRKRIVSGFIRTHAYPGGRLSTADRGAADVSGDRSAGGWRRPGQPSDPVQSLDLHLGHGVGHLVGAVAGEPVDTAPDEEVSVQFPGQAEQFPDVALAVGDVNAA